MRRVERQRLQSDIWGAYWTQCYIPSFSAFFTSFWKGKNCNRDSDVAESVLFPSEKGCITQEVQDRVFFSCSFEDIFSSFIGHDRQLDSLHTLMTSSHWRVKERRAQFISGCCTDANSPCFFASSPFRGPDSKCIKEAAARPLLPPFMTRTHKHARFAPFLRNHRTL